MRRIAFWASRLSAHNRSLAPYIDKPVRADYYSDEALAAMAKKFAAGQGAALPGFTPFPLVPRLNDNAQVILHAFQASDAAARRHETLTPATQWLIDNYYTIDKAIKQVRLACPRKLLRLLPPSPKPVALPRIFALAWFYIAYTDSNFSISSLGTVVRAYQTVAPLTIGELWILPAALRFVLVENARRIAAAIEHNAKMRLVANKAADKIALTRKQGSSNAASLLAEYGSYVGDAGFSGQLLSRLENTPVDTTAAIKWLQYKLAETAPADIHDHAAAGNPGRYRLEAEQNRQAANGVTMGNIIRAFKSIDDIDWPIWFESVCAVDFVLRDHSDFSALDAPSRNIYRSAVERIAKASPLSETEVAEQAVKLAEAAAHEPGQGSKQAKIGKAAAAATGAPKSAVADYLLGKKRPELEKACHYRPRPADRLACIAARLKIGSIALPVSISAFVLVLLVYALCLYAGLSPAKALVGAAMAVLPAIDIAFAIFNTIMSWYVPPRLLVGYAYNDGIPKHAGTLVAVPILISSRHNIDEQIRNLEVHYLSNPQGAIYFALISDWKDAKTAQTAEDLELLAYARAQIVALNRRYPAAERDKTKAGTGKAAAEHKVPLFHFLHRRRLFNPQEDCFMGWERKRGKLHELNRLLRGAGNTGFLPPDSPLPANIRYIMTLDSDTKLTPGSVAKFVGKLSHPLNRPRLDPKTRIVTEGYGLLQPRVTPSLAEGEHASRLQQLLSGERGLDPYVFAVSNVYQDIVAEGTYTGKGLYDIDAFEAAMHGRIRENTVLSHDLLEGGYARTAFTGDMEVVEDYPVSYYVDTARRHRWIRGDWQLLPYIFGKSGVSGITRWKMLDNLRRSLMPPAILAAFFGLWCFLPVKQALLWQIILLLGLYIAPLMGLVRNFFAFDRDYMLRGHIRAVLLQAGSLFAHIVLSVSFLAYSTWYTLDAIIRTIYRMTVSHKHLLEWQSSDVTKNLPRRQYLSAYLRMMFPAIILAVFVLLASWQIKGSGFYAGLPIMLLWLFSPFIAWFLSRPATKRDRLKLKSADAAALRGIARRNWAFYEEFVTADNHYLPPDNFQEDPVPVLARRTSPTNIGLYLLSTVAARDFGWINLQETINRIAATLATLDRLEKFHGHIYNWYETDTLEPSEPLYISTVDSGNLAGHLLALAAALKQWAAQNTAAFIGNMHGIIDNADILADELEALGAENPEAPALKAARQNLAALRRQIIAAAAKGGTADYEKQQAELTGQAEAATLIADRLETFSHKGSSKTGLAAHKAALNLEAVCRAHACDFQQAAQMAKAPPTAAAPADSPPALLRQMAELALQARQMAFAMQFGFLEHKDRRLLSIGYRVRENEIDDSCYDLLASEARLAVLFAIAKGDIKYEHWARLGRVPVPVGWKGALLSWSGSMFEYLMPPLVMAEPRGSLLDQTAGLVVRRQREYGAELGLPWGISEAAFNARDPQMNYQYSAFGVPSLGLARGLSRNRVIAPYAAQLAAQYAPRAAVANLKKLRKLGALGRYGYYDSVDFTPSRVPQGQAYALVRNYYAHHHGMSIAAIANSAANNIMRRRFHSDPAIEAVALLLQEKAPREIPVMNAKAFNPLRSDTDRVEQNSIRIIEQPITAARATQLLSGGAYNLMITARGSGYSTWNGMAVTRYQTDAAEDQQGSFLFLRDIETGRWWSATAEPTRLTGEEAKTVFTAEKAEFYKHIDGIHSAVECLATAGSEGESRRIKLFNRTHRDRIIEIISYSELALAEPMADIAHPVFSHLFVETEIADKGMTVFARRRRRSTEEPAIEAAHFVTGVEGEILFARAETDRRAFIGRGRSLRRPAFFDKNIADDKNGRDGNRVQGRDGFVLDPVFSICCRVKIPAHKKAELVFWTMAAAERKKLEKTISQCRRADAFEHEFSAVWTHSQIIRHRIGLSPQDINDYQHYATYLLFPEKQWQAPKIIAQKLGQQADLWPMSISGDLPLCVLRLANNTDLPVVKEILRAHEYWRECGLAVDLVLLNEQDFSYAQDTQHNVEWLAEAYRNRARDNNGKEHIFPLRKDQMSEQSYNTLLGAAHIVLHAGNGSLTEQLAHLEPLSHHNMPENDRPHAASLGLIARDRRRREAAPAPDLAAGGQHNHEDLLYWNGFGGFKADGSYSIRRKGRQSTPQPWINIIANEQFGMYVSAGGAPFTWAGNSRDYQLTPWSNDPVSNRPGEALYLVDLASKKRFSPVSAVECAEDVIYETCHGFGYSTFSSTHDSLALELTHTVDREQPLRLSRLRLTNNGTGSRSLRLYNYVEWVLGQNRGKTAPFLVPSYDKKRAAMLVSNPYSLDRPAFVSFAAAGRTPDSISADRVEFIGATGTVKHPQAIRDGAPLSGKVAAGGDACAAMAYDITLPPGETGEIVFCLGSAENLDKAHKLLDYARLADFDTVLAAQKRYWRDFTGGLQVETPDNSFNLMVNHWLPYQTYACRIKARAGFYQASGAFGLRDQLQDTLALLLLKPQQARAQILAAAARQFPEGDLQHWWLPESGAGVRGLIADDIVWLAYAAALYTAVTGDSAVLDEEVPFIEGEALPEGQLDIYFQPAISTQKASLYRHCCLALDLAIQRTGKNGLPLMLGGDWNDGMNHVGVQGRGESVWLGWFLGKTLRDFIPLAQARGDKERASAWAAHLAGLAPALEKAGWDGGWYRRAYYDDGTPLGSAKSDECQIDIIAQSWAVIADLAPPARQKQAMQAALTQLYDKEAQLLRLFWPPFDKTAHNPGYIKAYPPGIRENGGQYTHGALWSIIAAAQMGEAEKAYELLSAVNPIHHGAQAELYRVEPYVMAADIYSTPPYRGQGGWTWYTGSAGWFYRAATEAILGLKKQGDRLFLAPCLPESWDIVRLQWRFEQALYRITIIQQKAKETRLTVDGKAVNPAEGVLLTTAGEHEIILTLGHNMPKTAGAAEKTGGGKVEGTAAVKPKRGAAAPAGPAQRAETKAAKTAANAAAKPAGAKRTSAAAGKTQTATKAKKTD
ncbi:MAG: protein ndvB [Candidatus Tokpelaia sp.]|nr:MAG: protein ndvB [Candidatus Tokpelaia sp.]